jgi:hypothetical protein
MPAHRLPYRIPPHYAPMTPIAQWPSRLGSCHWPALPEPRRSRSRINGQAHRFDSDGQLSIVVWWMYRPFGRSTHRAMWGPALFHTTFIASDDEQQIDRVEAAMGVSLLELARKRLHRRFH